MDVFVLTQPFLWGVKLGRLLSCPKSRALPLRLSTFGSPLAVLDCAKLEAPLSLKMAAQFRAQRLRLSLAMV